MNGRGGTNVNFNKILREALDAAEQNEKGCNLCRDLGFSPEPFLVATHRGNQVETVFNYCPVCGRKL